jgi:hypothetical protein
MFRLEHLYGQECMYFVICTMSPKRSKLRELGGMDSGCLEVRSTEQYGTEASTRPHRVLMKLYS